MVSLNSHTRIGLNNVTAKHSFLKNPELKAMTFSHLKDKNDWTLNLKCLLNVALTCKDFLDVALDALWEDMDSFLPLLQLLPALQLEDDDVYVSSNVRSLWPYFVFRSLVEMWLRQIGIDCNITLEKSSFMEPWMTIVVIPDFIFRLIFDLLNLGHLLSFRLFVTSDAI